MHWHLTTLFIQYLITEQAAITGATLQKTNVAQNKKYGQTYNLWGILVASAQKNNRKKATNST